jgi:hypothetical protein
MAGKRGVHVAVVSQQEGMATGFIGAVRRLRDPLLLFAVPVVFAVLTIVWGWLPAWGIGFDFSGTLWEPARAVLHGGSIYPEPVRESILVGNPSVYPPPAILASIPLALLPQAVAAWLWFALLSASVLAALWILGVRDWRCFVVAATSPVVVQGAVFGNITVLLVLAIAVAWRYRDRTRVVGLAVGAGVAAKLVLWPLVVWLILTKRYRAAAWAVVSAGVLVFGAWMLFGFEGLTDYPALLRELQGVYVTRSVSLGTVAGGFGGAVSTGVAVCWIAGLVLLGVAAWLARRADGQRRAFALTVLACVVGSPIVWPYYFAFLLVPIAIARPRFGAVWLFGYAIWLVGLIAPKSTVVKGNMCCRPRDVLEQAWLWNHADPSPWYALGVSSVVLAVTVLVMFDVRGDRSSVRLRAPA